MTGSASAQLQVLAFGDEASPDRHKLSPLMYVGKENGKARAGVYYASAMRRASGTFSEITVPWSGWEIISNVAPRLLALCRMLIQAVALALLPWIKALAIVRQRKMNRVFLDPAAQSSHWRSRNAAPCYARSL